MNRLEFINALGGRLEQLPKEEVQKVLDYYVESINDRMEAGMSEEEVIEAFGDLDMLAAEILVEQGYLAPPAAPVPVLEPEPGSPDMPPPAGQKKHLPVWAVVLLILGSPIWLSLGVAAAAVGLSVYIVVLALLFSLWCIAISFAAAGAAGAVLSFLAPVTPDTLAFRLLACGACLVLAGIGVLLLPACRGISGGFGHLHRRLWDKIRSRKEAMA